MSESTFTHDDLARLLGVSKTTVKSYRRKFPDCIPVANLGKPIRFTAEALTVATRIRDFFQTGMSVPEARARLAAEFAWISPENPTPETSASETSALAAPTPVPASHEAPKSGGQAEARPGPAQGRPVGPELSAGVSNMAKTMVEMNQKQLALLQRLEGIEHILGELGLRGEGGNLGEIRDKSLAAAKAREEKLENRLNRLDTTTQELAGAMRTLAAELGRFLGKREATAREWPEEAEAVRAEADRISAEALAEAPAEAGGARILSLHQSPAPYAAPEPIPAASAHAEPPRAFLDLPLVVRSGEGRCVSAAGKGKGRLSVNGLKAILAGAGIPPRHFSFHWEAHGEGWRLHIAQEATGEALSLLLMETPTQNTGNVVELVQLIRGEDMLAPVEFAAVLEFLVENGSM